MPLIVEELNTSINVQDEGKQRRLIREELQRLMQRPRALMRINDVDPADPGGAGRPTENGRLA